MPSYAHLLTADLNFKAIGPLVKTAKQLGAPYDAELQDFEALARRQAEEVNAEIVKQGGPAGVYEKQALALIAYLQRLGTDINRTEEKPAEVEPAGEQPSGEATTGGEAAAAPAE